jgi:hypothetical protein
MWLTRVPNTESVVKTSTFERGSYYFFDPTVWETTRKVGPFPPQRAVFDAGYGNEEPSH